jgi:hypothetical protein
MMVKLCIFFGGGGSEVEINPLQPLFKALLQGQKDCIFFSGI